MMKSQEMRFKVTFPPNYQERHRGEQRKEEEARDGGGKNRKGANPKVRVKWGSMNMRTGTREINIKRKEKTQGESCAFTDKHAYSP